MGIITKKKVLSNFQGLDVAKTDAQANAGLIPSTPKIDTNSIIRSQIQQSTPVSSVIFGTDNISDLKKGVTAPVQNNNIVQQSNQSVDNTFSQLDKSANNWGLLQPAGPTNQQNADALAKGAATIAENAQKESEYLRGDLKYGDQQRDYQQKSLLADTQQTQKNLDRQLEDQRISVDRAISDTQRASERNLSILEKTAALQGTGKSSGFTQGLTNIKEDTIRTINRLQEDLTRATQATGEQATALWETYNKNKEKIDNDFEYQFRDFTNRQAASIAELTSAGFSPEKMNKAIDKIYEQAQYKTSELFTNYINNYQTLNSETRLQAQEIRTQEEYKTSQQKDFISQYIGYNGERLGSQTMQSLKSYLDNGQISQNDYNLYTEMLQNNTIETLQQYGMVQQGDLSTIDQLLTKGYSPTEAIAFMIQSNPDRFKPQQDYKAPNIQIIDQDANGNDIRGYFDPQTQQLVTIGARGTGQPYIGEFGDLTSIVKRTGNNVGKDTNNPGNIMADNAGQKELAKRYGAIGFYSSPNGRTYAVFNSMEDGKNAMMQDLQSKLSGGSSWATSNTSLAKFASGWVSGPNAPTNQNAVNAYVKFTGYPANTPIGNIPLDKLATAIMKNEGVDPTKSAVIGVPQAPQAQGGDLQSQVLGLTLGMSGTEGERLKIQKEMINIAQNDGISLQEAKKKMGISTPADNDYKKNMNEQYDGLRRAGSAMSQVRSAIKALDTPNATTDLIGIVGMLKSIDPNSVARSDEVANVENARSIIDNFVMKWEKLGNGKKLTPEQRTQLQNAMRTQVNAYDETEGLFVNDVVNEYNNRGLNPKDLFTQTIIDKYIKKSNNQTNTSPLVNQNQGSVSTSVNSNLDNILSELYGQ